MRAGNGLLLVGALTLVSAAALAATRVEQPVTDEAEVLLPSDEEQIERRLVEHRERTGVQIAVLTVRSTGGLPIEDFALEVAQAWGGGSRERDDGVLFVLAVDDRRMRLELGYGVEAAIPDSEARRILDGARSYLRSGDYRVGTLHVVEEVVAATRDFRPGEGTPASVRLRWAYHSLRACYLLYFLVAVGLGLAVMLLRVPIRDRLRARGAGDHPVAVTLGLLAVLLVVLTVVVALTTAGAWAWAPVLHVYGALNGLVLGSVVGRGVKKHPVMFALDLGLIVGFAFLVVLLLHVHRPVYVGTSANETALFGLLVPFGILKFFLFGFAQEDGARGSGWSSSGSYSSSSSSSSSSSRSSSSSSSSGGSSWSGGGGSFGGGGASSSW